MSERGCCAHCSDLCQVGEPPPSAWLYDHHSYGALATWYEGHCPACAAEERIVAWLRTWPRRRPQISGTWDVFLRVLNAPELADAIERGDHLGGAA